ncbi:EF-hand calcium-binding domain-containing protein 5 [Thoreauomyces humboldtii]|nr:EF-hand calcium-binding domain-containing protein 5 [Thoreauomyces humboldtii]
MSLADLVAVSEADITSLEPRGPEDSVQEVASVPLEFTKAIDRQRDTQPRSILDAELRDAATRALATNFLNVPDLDLDVRAYMVETTLPTLIYALEKLLREVERRNLIPTETGELKPSRETFAGGRTADAAPAADGAIVDQPDKPVEQFDAINWLAQFLYRNNPRFSNFSSATSSPYAQSMQAATKSLKERLLELENSRRAKARSEELQRRQDTDRAARIRSAQAAERQRSFVELLSTVFRKWTSKLWRPQPGFILHSEMLEAYKQVFRGDVLQTNPELMMKLDALITAQTPTARPGSNLLDASSMNSVATTPDADAAVEDDTDTASTSPSGAAPSWAVRDLQTKKFLDEYVQVHTTLTEQWTLEELSVFLKELSTCIVRTGDDIKERYAAGFFMPHFSDLPGDASKEQWTAKLLESLSSFSTETDGADAAQIRVEFEKFCSGQVDTPVDGEASARRASILDRRGSTLDQGSRPQSGQTGERATTPASGGILEAENAYRIFTRNLVATLGVESSVAFMEFLSETLGAEERRAATEKAARDAAAAASAAAAAALAAKAAEPERPTTSAETRNSLAGSLFEALQKKYGDGVTAADAGNMVARALTGIEAGSALHFALESMKADVAAQWTDLTHALGKAEFVSQIGQRSGAELSDPAYAELVELLIRNCGEPEAPSEPQADPEKPTAPGGLTAAERTRLEQAAIAEIQALGAERDTNVSGACTKALDILATALEKFHIEHSVRGRVSLLEQATTVDGTSTLLRHIATSASLRTELLGKTADSASGLEGNVFSRASISRISDLRTVESASADPFLLLMAQETVNRYLGVPLKGSDGHTIGVFGLNMLGSDNDFDVADASFIETAMTALVASMTRISMREKAMILAHAARQWAVQQSGCDVEVFLPEPAIQINDAIEIFRLDDFLPQSGEGEDSLAAFAVPESAFMRPRSSRMVRVAVDDAESKALQSAASASSTIETSDPDGRVSSYVPVTDASGHCVAVMRVKPRDPALKVSEDDMEEIKRTTRILASALECVEKEGLTTTGGLIADSAALDAESLDENSRRHLLFPKLMLQSARSALSKLNNNALSELRSYRKPPPTIHKVIKAVLYLFGKLPKEVEKWSDCCRFLNMDLLKKMIDYDPTAIQKKSRFQRVKRVLKTIPHGDVKKRGSVPAQCMSDWLVVSVDLRDQSLKRRKLRAAMAELEEEDDADEAEAEAEPEVDEEAGENGEIGTGSRLGTAQESDNPAELDRAAPASHGEGITVSGGSLPPEEPAPHESEEPPAAEPAHEIPEEPSDAPSLGP